MFAILTVNLPIFLCLLLGAALMIVEVFLPGFGLPGISGLVLIGVGTVMAWIRLGGMAAMAILLVLIAVLAILISWALRHISKGDVVHTEIFLKEIDILHNKNDMQVLVGKRGRTSSVLRPAGIGDFDGVRLNVVTEGTFIERNVPVEIVRVDGSRIVVRAVEEVAEENEKA